MGEWHKNGRCKRVPDIESCSGDMDRSPCSPSYIYSWGSSLHIRSIQDATRTKVRPGAGSLCAERVISQNDKGLNCAAPLFTYWSSKRPRCRPCRSASCKCGLSWAFGGDRTGHEHIGRPAADAELNIGQVSNARRCAIYWLSVTRALSWWCCMGEFNVGLLEFSLRVLCWASIQGDRGT